jgi:DNA primase large subunit
VSDLVGNRQAYLHKGKVYVPMAHQTSLVMDEFDTRLSRMLEVNGNWGFFDEANGMFACMVWW